MKPEQWQQVEQVYHAALELQSDERAAYVAEVCASDAALRREVESLLGYDAQAADFIEQPAVAFAAEDLAEEQSTMQIGQRISHYQILSQLGRGGMGEVFLAQDTNLQRQVALKLLPAQFTADRARVQRFEREARAASALNHPNILTIHEIGQTDGLHFLVTEYIDGQTLRQQMKPGRMELATALDMAIQIANALVAAHEAHIIHRDIKPENVMVRRDGLVKVLDFGLAKLLPLRNADFGMRNEDADTLRQDKANNPQSAIPNPQSTLPGLVMGTPRYMSPEQARGEKVDARSDIFSFGVMLYEMIAGNAPFRGATPSDVMAAILREEPPPLSRQFPECPAALERIVHQCLAKPPEQRYQTSAALCAELKAVRKAMEESQPTNAIAKAPTQEAPQPTKQLRQPRPRWIAIGSVAALIALLMALYFFRSGRDTAETAIKQLAVLPPRPLQASNRDEAMEMGTASLLITRLSSLRQLIVRSETAVEKYAHPEQDPLAAGREQKVDAVLDSRYQRSGDKVRFTLRLLRVTDGATLWADTLDQPSADLFAIQDALSDKVTIALRLTLSEAEKELMAKRYTSNAEAWQLYARGRQLVHSREIPEIEKAITYFERAIALDQRFALAHVMLGYTYTSLHFRAQLPPKEVFPKAKAAYDQALKLDDQLAEAHTFQAQYKQDYEWDFSGAEQFHQRALALNPNSADVHHHWALYLTYMGRFEEGIAEIRKAEELDPTDIFMVLNVAQVLYLARRYDEAIEQSRRAIDLTPNSGPMYHWMIKAYEMKGDEQAAFAAILKQAEVSGARTGEIAGMKAAFAADGLKGCWKRELDRQLEREKSRYVGHYGIATNYARLGDKERALARLEKAVEVRNFITTLNIEPVWDSYRSDPRFMALVRRIGLAP